MHEKKSNNYRVLGSVIGAPIDALNWDKVLSRLAAWAAARESRYVCVCNTHLVVTARKEKMLGNIVSEADMATPDGAPVAWLMRCLGFYNQERINGPDLMWRYCAEAAKRGESIYLYGSTPETLELLEKELIFSFPNLIIAGSYSPPFRPLTAEEDASVVKAINASGAGTVWVGLGCPKQEKWMAEHRGYINAPMIGVGAAFDYHSGIIKRAPLWMQNNGLEWLHRLCSEPRRLWKRYFFTNAFFIYYVGRQLLARLTKVESDVSHF